MFQNPESNNKTGNKSKEKAPANSNDEKYVLKLYITGMTHHSQEALRNIEKVCRQHLKNRYELEVIDIYQQPDMAKNDQIVAVPTLVKKLPSPLRRLIGDLSAEDRILVGLNLKPRISPESKTKKIKNDRTKKN